MREISRALVDYNPAVAERGRKRQAEQAAKEQEVLDYAGRFLFDKVKEEQSRVRILQAQKEEILRMNDELQRRHWTESMPIEDAILLGIATVAGVKSGDFLNDKIKELVNENSEEGQ